MCNNLKITIMKVHPNLNFDGKAKETFLFYKSVLLATVAGAITLFVLGYLIWGILLGPYFAANEIQYAGLSKQPPSLILLFLSNIVLAFLIAFIFCKWAAIRTFVTGLAGATLIGFLIHAGIELSVVGYSNLYKEVIPVIVDVLVETARTSVAGGVIGAVLGMINRNAK